MTRQDLFWGLSLGWFLVFQAAAWASTEPPPAATIRPLDFTAIVLAIIGGIPVTIAAITGLVLVLKKQDQVIVKQDENAHTMNHRLDELVAAVEKAALAKGEKIGMATEKAAAAERAVGAAAAAAAAAPLVTALAQPEMSIAPVNIAQVGGAPVGSGVATEISSDKKKGVGHV